MLIGMRTPEQGLVRKLFAFVAFIIAISKNCSVFFILLDTVKSKMGLLNEDDIDWFSTLDKDSSQDLDHGHKGWCH